MTPTEFTAHVSKLTEHQWRILEVLIQTHDQWNSRRQIANAIGKKRLIPYDIGCLQALVNMNLIDIQHVHDDTPIGYQVMYRISQQTVSALTQMEREGQF